MLSQLSLPLPSNTTTLATVLEANIVTDFAECKWNKHLCSYELMFEYIAHCIRKDPNVVSILASHSNQMVCMYIIMTNGDAFRLIFSKSNFNTMSHSSGTFKAANAGEFMKCLMHKWCDLQKLTPKSGYIPI